MDVSLTCCGVKADALMTRKNSEIVFMRLDLARIRDNHNRYTFDSDEGKFRSRDKAFILQKGRAQ
jgi:hypothetical protein